jgi:acyl-CoA hydrolase
MQIFTDETVIVDKVIEKVGKKIVLGTPLAAGKPNHILNAFYRRALEDPSVELTICTALTLQRPMGASDLEKRFMGPFQERVFGDFPDLDYEIDRVAEQLPPNVRVIEFYFPPGKFMNNPTAQQDYISTNYTHVVRDMLDRKINVLAQMVSKREQDGKLSYSLSSNPDVTVDMVNGLKECDYPVALVAQVNNNLPFMLGDAVVDGDFYEYVLDDPEKYFTVFGPPKMSVSDADHMVGLYSSMLVTDDGELQIGIGSLGDASVYSMLLRHEQNDVYRQVAAELKVEEKFGEVVGSIGGLGVFETGLFAASEMVVDGFMHLYKAGIIKKKVYDNFYLQRLLNEGVVKEEFGDDIIEVLLERRLISDHVNQEEFDLLKYWGVFHDKVTFQEGMLCTPTHSPIFPSFTDPERLSEIREHCLGKSFRNGQVIHGGFFLGPQDFYTWLRELPEDERKLINMKSVQKINQLYGHERLDRLHRKNARFINSCMMYTLGGGACSDGLEDGRVVSGVGGQYNFVAMAQELPDGHSILNLRSTRMSKGRPLSNIVPFYGNITIPRHLRDIVVTEYGIAFIRGKTDEEMIRALLNITDSRFQEELMRYAKSVGKLKKDYVIPEAFRNNYPHVYQAFLKKYKAQGLFQPFPFGTDLTDDEIRIGKALKGLKADMDAGRSVLLKTIFKALLQSPKPQDKPLLERMQLDRPKGMKEKLYRKLLLAKFREFDY